MEQVKSKDILDMAVEYLVLKRNIKMRIKRLEMKLQSEAWAEDLLRDEIAFLKQLVGEEEEIVAGVRS